MPKRSGRPVAPCQVVRRLGSDKAAAQPTSPPVLDTITAGTPHTSKVRREVWMTGLVASAQAADLSRQLEEARGATAPT